MQRKKMTLPKETEKYLDDLNFKMRRAKRIIAFALGFLAIEAVAITLFYVVHSEILNILLLLVVPTIFFCIMYRYFFRINHFIEIIK